MLCFQHPLRLASCFVLLLLLPISVSAQADDYPLEAGSCFDTSSGNLFAWQLQQDTLSKQDDDAFDLVFNRPNDFILDPDLAVPVRLRQGGSYPIDIVAEEPFTSALVRIEGEGEFAPTDPASVVSCGPGAKGILLTAGDDETTEVGGVYTVAEDATEDITIDVTLLYGDDEEESATTSYAYQRYNVQVALTTAPTGTPTEIPTGAPTTAPTVAPTTAPTTAATTMAPTTAPTTEPTTAPTMETTTAPATTVTPTAPTTTMAPTKAPTTVTPIDVVPPPASTAAAPTSPPTTATDREIVVPPTTESPTTVSELVSSQVGSAANDTTTSTQESGCPVCTEPDTVLGDLDQFFRVDRLPFNCRDVAERPELFDVSFCQDNAAMIQSVCGGCVPVPTPAPVAPPPANDGKSKSAVREPSRIPLFTVVLGGVLYLVL